MPASGRSVSVDSSKDASAVIQPPRDLERHLAAAIASATDASWRLERAYQEQAALFLVVADARDTSSLLLEVRATKPDVRAYLTLDRLSFSYRGNELQPALRPLLDRVFRACAALLIEQRWDPEVDSLTPVNGDAPMFPTPRHRAHLETPRPLPPLTVDSYRDNGHVLVRRALDRDVVMSARAHVLAALQQHWPTDLPPPAERPDAYARSFTQVTNIGLDDPTIALLSHSPRLARMAADLMGVESVRLFCEDWLIKEPGARITPWHQDEAVFPFEASATITCWIPFGHVGPRDGLLRFARGSQRFGLAAVEDIGDDSEEIFNGLIEAHGFPVDHLPEVWPGDVSFHDGRCFHGAQPNDGDDSRVVLALHYFADGARIRKPATRKHAQVLEGSAPGLVAGDLAESPRWPAVLGPNVKPRRMRAGGECLHLRATLLPDGEGPQDLWVVDGRLQFTPVDGARTVETLEGFVTSGLVDAHSHLSYPHGPDDRVETEAWMNARRAVYAATGVTLVRDMGAVGDEISALGDVPGLPRVHACGTMILRYEEFPFTRTEPADLVRACTERVKRGARWVKVFADWTDDYQGRLNTGFTGDDEVTYPAPVLAEAVAAVHSLGGRVAAHCFTKAGVEAALAAGVDSLEHGWGAERRHVEAMAANGVAWAPLVGIAGHMWRVAREQSQPHRAEWIEQTMESLSKLLPLAEELGVRLLAGTDMFPDVTVADEVRQLHELGVSLEGAVAAGTWGARDWLAEPGLTAGAVADLVLYRTDPRLDPGALWRPELVLVGGRPVAPSFAQVRPSYRSWRERATDASTGRG